MKLTIEHDTLKALLLCAAKKDVRYYLNGILIDVRENDATLVATTGSIILAVPLDAESIEDRTIGQFIIPRELIEAVKPMMVGRSSLPVTITIGSDGACSVQGATTASGKLVDGTYPYWRRVIPTTASGEAGQFDPDLWAIFADVRRLLSGAGKSRPILHHNGTGSARVSNLGAEAIGVIAPMRYDQEDIALTTPAWAQA
jgi:DNA polymerase-3 subunit beta